VRSRERNILIAVALIAALVTAGCLRRSFPERKQFNLELSRPGSAQLACDCTGRVERVHVARQFENRGFVYKTNGETEEDFWNEFFLPPGALIRERTQSWLRSSGLFRKLVPASMAAPADWLIEGRVNKLYADMRKGPGSAVLEIEWTVRDGSSRDLAVVLNRIYGGSLELEKRSAPAIAEAWAELLTRHLTTFEAHLREFFAARTDDASTND